MIQNSRHSCRQSDLHPHLDASAMKIHYLLQLTGSSENDLLSLEVAKFRLRVVFKKIEKSYHQTNKLVSGRFSLLGEALLRRDSSYFQKLPSDFIKYALSTVVGSSRSGLLDLAQQIEPLQQINLQWIAPPRMFQFHRGWSVSRTKSENYLFQQIFQNCSERPLSFCYKRVHGLERAQNDLQCEFGTLKSIRTAQSSHVGTRPSWLLGQRPIASVPVSSSRCTVRLAMCPFAVNQLSPLYARLLRLF